MKLRTKIKCIAMPVSVLGLVAAPILTATSCSNYDSLFFTVTNNRGLSVEFCDVGASIANMKIGNTFLTYHPKDKGTFVDYAATPYYYGKILGRVGGRFKDGKFKLDGNEYTLQVNEKGPTKNNCLHGGKDSFSFKKFNRETKDETDYTSVKFTYTSPDGEAGFPGEVKVTCEYRVYKNKNSIQTILDATTNKKTLINLSTHPLFRLGNDGDVLDYVLTIPTQKRVEYDLEDEMKTGQIPVGTKDVKSDDGIYDFSGGKVIGKDIYASAARDPISNGYDHIWYVGDEKTVANRYVNLYNPKNHLNFRVTAGSEAVTGFIIYSNCYPRAGQIMCDDKEDQLYSGITIEPYTYFTAESLDNITYDSEKSFHSEYTYDISFVQPK